MNSNILILSLRFYIKYRNAGYGVNHAFAETASDIKDEYEVVLEHVFLDEFEETFQTRNDSISFREGCSDDA